MTIQEQIERLEPLVRNLLKIEDPKSKLALLDPQNSVPALLKENFSSSDIDKLGIAELVAVAALIAIGQTRVLFGKQQNTEQHSLGEMLRILVDIDHFYDQLGGIAGYHLTVLKLIQEKLSPNHQHQHEHYFKPQGIDLADNGLTVRQAVVKGIESLPQMAEIYPVGGAGDRLSLQNGDEPLPAARLLFCGRTLLEGLIRDLQAREYLYFKIYGRQVTTPIGLMTSHEKHNHRHICEIGEESNWFGRPHDSFLLFTQPLVPVITVEGNWVMNGPLQLLLKPGGHGVLWKQAEAKGILAEMINKGHYKVLVRQINNPLAGTDNGLLAFSGMGFLHNYNFGFMSCPRFLNSAEGVLVCVEKNNEKAFEYCISNIEYTEFKNRGIHDAPLQPGTPYSVYPSNTNILFGDLESILRAIHKCSIPGMLINMKNKYPYIDENGLQKQVEGGRLESTMQNISDWMVDSFPSPITEKDHHLLSTFVIYNERRKTIASTKNSYIPEKSTQDTPEGAFYTLMQNGHSLLSEMCHIELPPLNSLEDYLTHGPSLLFLYHPALGPLYSIIAQKIQGGSMGYHAELQLEIVDLHIEYLHLHGSLLILADSAMGHRDKDQMLRFSHDTGKCVLKNVTINNQGIDRGKEQCYWKNAIERKEAVSIRLHGNAEFFAENVVFSGSHDIDVPQGHRMTAYQTGDKVHFTVEKIPHPSWQWEYKINNQSYIILTKQETP